MLDRIPTWGWVVAGLGVVVLALMMRSGGSSASYTSAETPAVDVNDILSQLQDAADQLGGGTGSSTGGSTTVTKTITSKNYWGSDIPKGIRTLSSESAVTLFKKYKVNFGTTINMGDLKRLLKKMGINYGKTLTKSDLVKAGIIPEPPTVTSSNTVQSSNNEVGD